MTNPTIDDFKAFFRRDFPFGTDDASVMDEDLNRALAEADTTINGDLFGDPNEYRTAFLYLMAHHLVVNIRNSSQGLSGQFNWLVSGKGVGGVSQSFTIPESITKNPVLALLATTSYGAKYLSIAAGYLTGNIGIAGGATLA